MAKNNLATLGITAAAPAIDIGIQKKIHGSGTTTLIITNKKMNDTIEIIQALEDSNILHKGITKKNRKWNKKKQEGGFLGTLVGTLGSILLGNSLSGKEIVRAGSGNKKGKGIAKACYEKEWDFFILHHPLTNFEIEKYYQNEPRFNGVFARDNLPKKIKHKACNKPW